MRASATLLALMAFAAVESSAHGQVFQYVSAPVQDAVAIDARPAPACQTMTVKGARCLPPDSFLGPHRRLAATPDMLWTLGASGLSGGETVMVIGDDPTARDFVAGLLYLSGQRQVLILRMPVNQALASPQASSGPGTVRGVVRETVFHAAMRDELWVLRGELAAQLQSAQPPFLIDGRSESEYWGETVRTARGGHLPGAESLPAASLRAALARNEKDGVVSAEPVAYAHDAVEGIAYFTLLRAGLGVAARVYPGGWSEWASDGTLPADAATFPDRAAARTPALSSPAQSASRVWLWMLASAVMGALAAIALLQLGGRMRRKKGMA